MHLAMCADGHSGSLAVDYVADHVLPLAEQVFQEVEGGDAADLLRVVVRRLCTGLYDFMREKMPDEQMNSGTTATIVLVGPSSVSYAHVGDSRALLVRGGKAVQLTRDHRPTDDEERQRIFAAGGRITYTGIPRVDGRLAMTRALGAFYLRNQGVTCEPDVGTVPLDGSVDNALIVATDGLFDELRNDEVVAVTRQHKSAADAAKALGEVALMYRARDNVSAAVVPLPAWGDLYSPDANNTFGFDRHLVRRAS